MYVRTRWPGDILHTRIVCLYSNYEACWRIRAANPNDVIVFDTVDFDVEEHQVDSRDVCAFDQIRFYREVLEATGKIHMIV